MKDLIEQFKKHAKELSRDVNSLNELKLWVNAHKTVEFNKIFQENKGFKSMGAYDIIKVLRDDYKLEDLEVHNFIRTYILNPTPELNATMELDRTDGKPGGSYAEVLEDITGLN